MTTALVRIFVCIFWIIGYKTILVSAADIQRLTDDGLFKRDPVFVHGGTEIVYSVQQKSTLMVLYRLRLSDGHIERLHPQAILPEFNPSFSADGQSYVFIQSRGNDNLTVVYRQHGQPTEKLVGSPAWGAAIRPDGSQIVYSRTNQGGKQLVSIRLDGTDSKYLTATQGFNTDAAFSADGGHIAFSSSRAGDLDLYVMGADGSNVRRLSESQGLDIQPAWSPRGLRIAFTSVRDGNREIYIIGVDGTGVQRVTHHPERDDFASWHPDGQRLITVGERNGRFDLYLIPVE